MTRIHIAGCGMTSFGARTESLPDLFLEAAGRALEDAGNEDFDAVFIGSMNPDELTGNSNTAAVVCDHLGIVKPSLRIETASSTGAAVFNAAFLSIASGHYSSVMVLAGEKMTHLPTPVATRVLSKVLTSSERAYGASMPALAALVTRRYMHDFGLTRETLGMVAVKNHGNGSLNPYAHFRKKVSLDKVLGSRMIADPLRLYDCAPISDGACAVLLTSGKGPVKVVGIGHAADIMSLNHRPKLTAFPATRAAAREAYDMAHIGPGDIDVAEVHDAFTTFEIIDTEDLGFFGQGEGGRALAEGKTALGGELPVNPSGGLKSRGHPVGASGLAQIVELYWHLTGNAGQRQVEGARYGLAQSIGGLANNNLVTVLEASP